MNFHETMMGQKFFTNQLPRLINSLEGIRAALNREQKPVMVQVPEVQSDFLTELYYGNVEIGASSERGYSDQYIKELLADGVNEERIQELEEKLTPEQCSLYLRCQEVISKFAEQEAGRMFEHGFQLAIQLIVAGLSTHPDTKEIFDENV